MNSKMTELPVEIVMVEDDEGHARLIEKNIRRAGVNNKVLPFANGTDAVKYLFGPDGSGTVNKNRPLLVLLDLNLPDMTGVDILKKIKTNDHLKRIPVVVLTTSQAEEDILKVYDLRANCYVTKPVDLDQFIKVVKSIDSVWFTIVSLPPE
jgi:DNA-binding response OmpR family regulator